MSEKEKSYTITDRRGMSDNQEHPEEVCRVCGSKDVHSKKYGQPTMECIKYLQGNIRIAEASALLLADRIEKLGEKIGRQNANSLTFDDGV